MTAQERDEGSLLAPGDLVSGEYVVDAVAQKGAGWIWYRGHHVERTDELVTITSLRADAPSAGYIEAFARRSQWLGEARIPNVPPLLASGVEMGLPFIVTPWVDGTTLRQLLDEEGSLSRDEALRIIKAVGESLDAMHARRPVVVHQLLSLNNIRIDAMTRAARLMDAGVAHALRLARVEDVHGAAKVEAVFRAPEDSVGRTPSPAIDRFALAKLAEALLAPIPAGSTLARVISRGSSDLSASRFSTCASFVQSLALALKEARPADAVPAATHSPGAGAVAAATKSPVASAIAAATVVAPTPTAMTPAASPTAAADAVAVPSASDATRSPTAAAVASATHSPAAAAIASATHSPAGSAIASATHSPAAAAIASATQSPGAHGIGGATTSPSPSAIATATPVKPAPPPLPTPAKPMAPPIPRSTKSTLVGVAPPALPKKGLTSTLVGIAPPITDAHAAAAPPVAPAEISAPVGIAPSTSTSEEPRFPFAPEPTKTDKVEIDLAMRDASLDEELSVGDQSIMEVVPDDLGSLAANAKKPERVSEPAPFEVEEPPVAKPSPILPVTLSDADAPVVDVPELGLAKTMLSSDSASVAKQSTAAARPAASAPEPSVEFDDPFPAIPPLDASEKERQAEQSMDVPPLFEAAPPVPAPISPDATSGMPPVSVERVRRSRSIAIGVAVMLGLAGGVGGGIVLFKKIMQGEDSPVARGLTAVVDASTAQPVVDNPAVLPVAQDDAAAALVEPASDDAALAAQSEDSASNATDDANVAQPEAEDAAVVANAPVEDSGVPGPVAPTVADSGIAAAPVNADGLLVVAGTSGLSSPDWRVRGGARRAVRERVELCGQGQVRGTARFEVRFDGATGRVIQFALAGPQFRNTPVGECVERAMRSVAVPPFTDPHWDTDYAVPLR
jgi:serine/threonine protein kinase